MAPDFAPPTDLCLSTGGMRLLIQPLLKVVYGLLPFCWFCCVWCFLLFMLICLTITLVWLSLSCGLMGGLCFSLQSAGFL